MLLKKNNIVYTTIIIAILLIVLSIFIRNLYFKLLIIFSLMSIIIYWITNDIYQAIILSFTISLLFYITNCQFGIYEGFEEKDKEIDVDKIIGELTNLSSVERKDNIDEIKEEDLELLDDKTPTTNNDYMVKSAKAQRETHRLIDTIKQLQDTVENLTPALKQGASIIEQFKKLNLVN